MDRSGMRICSDCMAFLKRPRSVPSMRLATSNTVQWRAYYIPATARPRTGAHYKRSSDGRVARSQLFSTSPRTLSASTDLPLKALHSRVLELSTSVLRPDDSQLPTEQRVLYVLEQLDSLAKKLLDEKTIEGAKRMRSEQTSTTATSALLGSVNTRQYPSILSKAALTNLISEKAEEIYRHPAVFISSGILKNYVDLQTSLHHPASFPEVFTLYASKPVPSGTSKNIKYTTPSANQAKAAVAPETANTALTSAMDAQNLPLALDIIDTTFCAPAFKKSKLIRQALVPGTLLTLAPVLAYTLSTQFSHFQTSMDPSHATTVAFAGIMTYVATVSGLGYVVVTTANDQMDRVTWAKGVPLWERWVREEERAALDRVAGKWGFQDVRRRGEEDGEQWRELREFVGLRGMVLDQVELMEGME